MLVFPNAKINLGLNIVAKRNDGYHDIESCLYPIPWHDALEAVPSDKTRFTQTGLEIAGKAEDNLCLKAVKLLKEDLDIPDVDVHLHKVIPMGAGLGGGSADGALMLKLLNSLFELGLSIEQLEDYAARLGSDCPFFIKNVPSIATGRGTELTHIALDLSDHWIGIKYPRVHVSTREAYSSITPMKPSRSVEEVLKDPIARWQGDLLNDFQLGIVSKYPAIGEALRSIMDDQPQYAAMSGSGAAVFGFFEKKPVSENYDLLEKLIIKD